MLYLVVRRDLVNDLLAGSTDPDLFAVIKEAITYPRWMVALAAEEHHAGGRDWCFTVNNTTRSSLAGWFGMPFDHVDALNEQPIFLGIGKSDFALLTSITAGNDQHRVIFPDFHV